MIYMKDYGKQTLLSIILQKFPEFPHSIFQNFNTRQINHSEMIRILPVKSTSMHDQNLLLLLQQVVHHHLNLAVVEAAAVEILLVVSDVRAVQEDVVRTRLREELLECEEVLDPILLSLPGLCG